MNGWQPIETAPKDSTLIVCWREDWDDPCFLRWKTNPRLVQATPIERGDMADSYFGDPVEWDDYYLAKPGGGPTHWHPLAPVPTARQETER